MSAPVGVWLLCALLTMLFLLGDNRRSGNKQSELDRSEWGVVFFGGLLFPLMLLAILEDSNHYVARLGKWLTKERSFKGDV